MARRQILLVRQDAGVKAGRDADVLAQALVTLGGKLWRHAADGTQAAFTSATPHRFAPLADEIDTDGSSFYSGDLVSSSV